MYTFQVCWVPGKIHLIADPLSRASLFASELSGLEINTAISCLSQTSQPAIRVIYDAVDDVDDDYRQLLEDVKCGTTVSTYSQALKGSLDILSISHSLSSLTLGELHCQFSSFCI